MTKSYMQHLMHGTKKEIEEAILDIIKNSEKPILAKEIEEELNKRGLKVKNVRSISQFIHYRLEGVTRKIPRKSYRRTYVYECKPTITLEKEMNIEPLNP